MARGYPERHADVGKLVDLGLRDLTAAAVPVTASSRPVVSITIHNNSGSAGIVLVGDALSQSVEVAVSGIYTVRAADAGQVYIRAAGAAATVGVHILEP